MAHFSASEYYKGKQCTNIYLPGYSEGFALHKLLLLANFALEDLGNPQNADEYSYDHFTIIIGGRSLDFIMGCPQYEALVKFIEHVAAENLHYVDPKLKYVEGVM